MDDPMARLPKYVFRRTNGSYRYKRNVPKHLLPLIGKETLHRQLGDTLQAPTEPRCASRQAICPLPDLP